MIQAAKKAIYAILNSADITDEELLSAEVGAEGLISSRRLTYQSVNPQDPVPLTPNHLLQGQLGGRFVPDTVDSTGFNFEPRTRSEEHRLSTTMNKTSTFREKYQRQMLEKNSS